MSELLSGDKLSIFMGGRGMIIPGLAKATLEAAGKERNPHVLLVGTACTTEEDFTIFINEATDEFKAAGAEVTTLHKFNQQPSKQQIADRVGRAAVIWGSFGDTLHAMEEGRKTGANQAIAEAALAGTVIGGDSAGMLTSFKKGHSDSLSYRTSLDNPNDWDYIFVEGMGLVQATGCPHYNTTARGKPPRSQSFMDMLTNDPTAIWPGIGIDNEAVLHLNKSGYRIMTRTGFDHGVHLLSNTSIGISEDRLPKYRDFAPLPIAA